jgi:hypothetical protein
MERISRKNLNFSCFVIGTTIPEREENMIKTLSSIDKENFPFIIKYLSIDDFGQGLSDNIKNYVESNGWVVLIEPKGGMVKNQLKALNKIDSEWVLYCEDDVIVEKLPNLEQIDDLLNKNHKVGIISLTGGGYNDNINQSKILNNIKKDFIKVGDDEIFWFRDTSLSNAWFFEFPSMFVKTKIFKDCINTSLNKFRSIQIEQSYTKSYFHLNYHIEYDRYTWVRDFNNYLDYNENVKSLLDRICNKLVYIKHNRNNYSPSVGSGYIV